MATTWNTSDHSDRVTLSNGNETAAATHPVGEDTEAAYLIRSTTGSAKSSGKWYFEVVIDSRTASNNTFVSIGVALTTVSLDYGVGNTADGWALSNTYNNSNTIRHNNSSISSFGTAPVGSVIGVAYDLDNGYLWFSIDDWWGGYDPVDPAHTQSTGLSGSFVPAISWQGLTATLTGHFKASDLVYSIPSGFSSLEPADPTESAIAVTLTGVTGAIEAHAQVVAAMSGTLDGVTSAVSAKVGKNITVASTLTGITSVITSESKSIGAAALTWPTRVLTATGELSNATAALTWPTRTLVAYGGGSATLSWPARVLTATGTVESIATAELTWPTRVLSAEGVMGGVGSAELTWPARSLAAYGGGSAALTWPVRTLTVEGTLEIVGTAALVWPARALTATGLTGGVGTAALTWPARILTATGLTGGVGTAALVWPTRTLTVTVACSGIATETTYAINLSTGAVTQLLLGAFDKLVTAHGQLYGLRDGALVRLDGDLDGTATIPATIRFAPQQFGTYAAKRLDGQVYLNTRENDGVTLTLVQDETTSWAYQTATDTAPALGTHRVKVGRGVTFHSLGLTLQNRNGGRLDVGGLELPVLPLSRKPK